MSRKQTEDNEVVPSPREYSKYTYKSFNFDPSYICGEDNDDVVVPQVRKNAEQSPHHQQIYEADESLLDAPKLAVGPSKDMKETDWRTVFELDVPHTLKYSLSGRPLHKNVPREKKQCDRNAGWEMSFVGEEQVYVDGGTERALNTDNQEESAWVDFGRFPHRQFTDEAGKAPKETKKNRKIMWDLQEMEEDMNVFKHIETNDVSQD